MIKNIFHCCFTKTQTAAIVERNSLTDNTLPTLRAAKGEHVV